MEGQFTLLAVEPVVGSAPAGNLYWQNPATDAAGPCTEGTVVVVANQQGGVEAVVQSTKGLQAGQDVYISGSSQSQFNDFAVIAAIKNNVVTLDLDATGSSLGGTLTILQTLPTTGPEQAQVILEIARDSSGNVIARVPDVGGYDVGQVIYVVGVQDPSFNGLFELVGVTTSEDGIKGNLFWQQAGAQASSLDGTIVGDPDPLINFDDNSLENSSNVTSQLTAIPAPKSLDIFYSETLDKMVYTTGKDSNHYFSDSGDPGNVQSPDGILGVAISNGKKTICLREMLNGELISLKENSGHAVTAGNTPASQWGVSRRWFSSGPCGVRAVDVGNDFLIYFDENSGPYRYSDGVSRQVGLEHQGTWDRLNKSAKEQVYVVVDEASQEVRIGIPLDCALVPNFEMVLNYFNGWDEPLMLTMSGEEMPNPRGRRWSMNDRPARLGKIVERDLVVAVDSRIDHRQMLYGMEASISDPGTFVDMTVPDVFDDNGIGIDSRYRPAFLQEKTLEILKWMGFKGRASGSGLMKVTPVTEDANFVSKPIEIDLTMNVDEG
jgi:hypothetical protein